MIKILVRIVSIAIMIGVSVIKEFFADEKWGRKLLTMKSLYFTARSAIANITNIIVRNK